LLEEPCRALRASGGRRAVAAEIVEHREDALALAAALLAGILRDAGVLRLEAR
jgi:hypothetical protein